MPDFLVIGGGIAGASAGYFLAAEAEVVLLERESTPGYHATGRSAALYTENYGNAVIRALTMASRSFFDAPPEGFGEHKLLARRGVIMMAPKGADMRFEAELAQARRFVESVHEIPPAEALERCPAIDADWLGRALFEPDAMDMDVHAIHQGYLRGLRARGGRVVTGAELLALVRTGAGWEATTSAGRFVAPVVIDAAGAWADEVAKLAGAAPIGLVPRRRTAFTIAPPDDMTITGWPMVIEIAESFYFKPESGRILVSPADETPMPPSDVQPDELDIATAAARLEAATTLRVRRIAHKWAGLRSFAKDRTPVAGFAPEAPGFFWLAGQGGYGIMTSPALGRITAALARGRELPGDIAALGVSAADLSPTRFSAPH
jgi:D-arginine dehydrogenase